jgi:hypothetical protein
MRTAALKCPTCPGQAGPLGKCPTCIRIEQKEAKLVARPGVVERVHRLFGRLRRSK